MDESSRQLNQAGTLTTQMISLPESIKEQTESWGGETNGEEQLLGMGSSFMTNMS